MKIIVVMKQVPDTETKIKVKGDGSGIETDGIKYVVGPYDEYAVEEALRLKEKLGDGSTVTVVSIGPQRAIEAIRTALAMGADDAIHVNDPAMEGSDSLGAARTLAKAIQDNGFDIIFGGKQAVDLDQIVQILALACLSLQHPCHLGGFRQLALVPQELNSSDA